MAVFRVEKNSGYTVMSNHHLRNRALSLKAKGLLSQMLSLPEDWDYTLQGLARINRESIDAIRQAIRELEQAGYIQRSRERDEKGRLRGSDYVIFELPQPVPASVSPTFYSSWTIGEMMQTAYMLNFIVHTLCIVFFEQAKYNRTWRCAMDYMTLKETAEKWNVTPRQVNYLCSAGRIPGAVKMASVWLVPKNADKPVDGRTKQGKELKNAEDTLR